MRVLVTGGAGYVGSVLVAKLLQGGHNVRVLDSLLFGGESLLGVCSEPGFEFLRGDIRDVRALRAALDGVHAVIHLAALVGDPACALDRDATRAINQQATGDLVRESKRECVRRFILASTCSTYGASDTSVLADEEFPLNPVSLYGETKVAAERSVVEVADRTLCTTVLRVATVFGLSPRMRFDLLLNELVRDGVQSKRLLIYGPKSWRPFVHIRDVAEAFVRCLEASEGIVRGQVFNIGLCNCQKGELAELLRERVPDVHVAFADGKKDPRDYRVSFEKSRRLGLKPQFDVEAGIREIAVALEGGVIRDPFDSRYRNVS